MSNHLIVSLCVVLQRWAPRAVVPVVAAVAAETAEEAERRRDDETVSKFSKPRVSSSTRRSYGDQLPRYRNFFWKRRGWSLAAAYSDKVWMEDVGPPPRCEVWTRRLRIREFVIMIAWCYEELHLTRGQIKRFCVGLADQLRVILRGDLADLLQCREVMVARNYGYRESARVEAMARDERACRMLEGHLVVEYARAQWKAGEHSRDMRLVDRAIGSTILLSLVQCSLRISSLCRTESVGSQTGPAATRVLAPDGGVALDRNILWCVDVSFSVIGIEEGERPVVRTAWALSRWWAEHPSASLVAQWMGVAFRSTKTNADGKRANKFRVDRDCVENCEYLDRMRMVAGMGAYERECDPFFSRPVSERVERTLGRQVAGMVDGWSRSKRADHEHEGRVRHVFRDTFANLLAKEIASENGLDDSHVSTKSLKILAITTLEEARAELGLTQGQVAAYCDHKSLAGNAAYKQLADRKTTLSLAAVAPARSSLWGASAVPEPVESQPKKRALAEGDSVATSSASLGGRQVQLREGKRAVRAPVKFGD